MRASRIRRRLAAKLLAACLTLPLLSLSEAQRPVVAPLGCPVFHCTNEATGVIHQPLLPSPTTLLNSNTLGTLAKQGCSSDGVRMACLFKTDAVASGPAKGTLKVLDAATLQPLWGSAGVPDSYDIDPSGFTAGEVPVMFADGRIAAGDWSRYVIYDGAGKALKSLALDGVGIVIGMTLISDRYAVISQATGVLTLVDLASWTKVSQLTLLGDGGAIGLVSPSSGSKGVLYAVAFKPVRPFRGYLYAVVLGSDPKTRVKLVLRSTFTYLGATGASPVIVPPSVTGLAGNLILLHTPGLVGEGSLNNHRLMGLLDTGGATIGNAWPPIALPQPLEFAPTVDEVAKDFYFQYKTDRRLFHNGLLSGLPVAQYDLAAIGAFDPSFTLNGHVLSNQSGGVFTLLLSGGTTAATPAATGQYVMGFRPLIDPTQLLWLAKIAGVADDLTAAWVTGPSSQPGVACPVVVGSESGLSRICD